jgi:hypothetical protein
VKQLYDGPRLAGLDGFHLEATQLLLRLGHLREQASQMLGNVIQQPVRIASCRKGPTSPSSST